ncbi:ACP S-malonyltransferase [uncultured Desulfovibrio sp.]|uniref:ACP S-malonyltransferase n=1 Tax=uncultured Desulfovibrio sp. TaxID=167968 RepID=UPI0026062022|nr:ACP S-malonyltransferase [uncultured Desulfovibrio sp.]
MTEYSLLFPGQGSQTPGMGRDVAEARPEAMQLWKRAEAVSGLPLREIFWEGDDAAMSDTRALQPALTVVNLNLWRELSGRVTARAAAGHSLGEFSALAAAGVLDEESTLRIVSLRGRLMAEADPDRRGGMAALLKMTPETVAEIVAEAARETDSLLIVANYNTPGQLVASGSREAVECVCAKAKERKGRGVPLAVSGAFHSPMMEKANKELDPLLRKAVWRKPRFPVYCNVLGEAVTDGESARDMMLRQMTSSVRWIDTMRNEFRDGVRHWLELGPKPLLGKMVAPCVDAVASPEDKAALSVRFVGTLEDAAAFQD